MNVHKRQLGVRSAVSYPFPIKMNIEDLSL